MGMQVTFDAELKEETDEAYLFMLEDPNGGDPIQQWVPKSVCEWDPTSEDEVKGEVHIANWFCRKEGLL